MKLRHILLLVITAATLASCHTKRDAARRDDSNLHPPGGYPATELWEYSDVSCTQKLMAAAYSWIGTPYRYGGQTKKGTDCSGLVMSLYNDALGIKLPRVSKDQGEYCREVKKKDLVPGDLVFFAIDSHGRVNHVGMYVGDGKMIHASSSKGVMESSLSLNYYVKYFHHAGKVTAYHDLIAQETKVKTKRSDTPSDPLLAQSTKTSAKAKSRSDDDETETESTVGPTDDLTAALLAQPLTEATQPDDKCTPEKPQGAEPAAPAISHAAQTRLDSINELQADTVRLMVYLPR